MPDFSYIRHKIVLVTSVVEDEFMTREEIVRCLREGKKIEPYKYAPGVPS